MHEIITTWHGKSQFVSTNPSGNELQIDTSVENGGDNQGLRPKALMLSALAGCSGLDIASVMRKMRLEVENFHIKTIGFLTEDIPQTYHKVQMEYHFEGNQLNTEKLHRAVQLSVEKYCGVLQMFRQFATIEIKIFFNGNETLLK